MRGNIQLLSELAVLSDCLGNFWASLFLTNLKRDENSIYAINCFKDHVS